MASEIAAIAQLQAMQQSEAFEKAAIEAGKSPFRSAKNLLDDPVGTLSAIPEGIGSIFNRAHEQLRREGRSPREAAQLVRGYYEEVTSPRVQAGGLLRSLEGEVLPPHGPEYHRFTRPVDDLLGRVEASSTHLFFDEGRKFGFVDGNLHVRHLIHVIMGLNIVLEFGGPITIPPPLSAFVFRMESAFASSRRAAPALRICSST